MSAEEDQQSQSQSGYDEQAGGPGAPTPLGALEVCSRLGTADMNAADSVSGCCWTLEA
jgi:hypothetical protein